MSKSSAGQQMMDRVILQAKKRRARALALQQSGLTVQQVGDRLGVTKQRASELLARAKRELGGA